MTPEHVCVYMVGVYSEAGEVLSSSLLLWLIVGCSFKDGVSSDVMWEYNRDLTDDLFAYWGFKPLQSCFKMHVIFSRCESWFMYNHKYSKTVRPNGEFLVLPSLHSAVGLDKMCVLFEMGKNNGALHNPLPNPLWFWK